MGGKRIDNIEGGLTLLDFKIYCKVTVIKTLWNWQKNTHIYRSMEQNREPINRDHEYSHLIFDKESKAIQRRRWTFQQMVLEHMQKNESRHRL